MQTNDRHRSFILLFLGCLVGLIIIVTVGIAIGYLFLTGNDILPSNPRADNIDIARAENLVRKQIENSELLVSVANLAKEISVPYGGEYTNIWDISEFETRFVNENTYRVKTQISFQPKCTADWGWDGTKVDGTYGYVTCYDFFVAMVQYSYGGRFEFDCPAEWIVVLDTQELVPQNECTVLVDR